MTACTEPHTGELLRKAEREGQKGMTKEAQP